MTRKWTAEDFDSDVWWLGDKVLRDESGEDVVWCYSEDADLLTAAPEMLEALKEMRAAMKDYEMDVDEPAPYKHRDMMQRTDAVIAKAEGGTDV